MVSDERRGDVAVITIERPDVKNAVVEATPRAPRAAWPRFDDTDAVAEGVLAGAGEDFSAGADRQAMALAAKTEGCIGGTRLRVDKPTVAAVKGHCVAGGLEMTLWWDLRVADETAVFGYFEHRFGGPLLDGGTQRLPRVVGLGRTLEMIETGRPGPCLDATNRSSSDRWWGNRRQKRESPRPLAPAQPDILAPLG